MPIKGLTNELRMPRAGKIHLGVKSITDKGQEYPTPTDYFVCPPEVIEAIGTDKPKELTIMFPTEEPEQFAPTYLKFFSRTRGLVCKGDGETADRTVNMRAILGPDGAMPNMPDTPEAWPVVDRDARPEDIGRHTIECRGDQCPDYGKRGCGRMMMLQFLMPDVPGLGIYQIDTGSRNGILNIYGGIELVRAIVGRVSMIPLKLRIGPIETVSPETGRKQTNYVMSLHCDLTMEALSQYRRMRPGADLSSRQLPDPDDEVPEYLMAAELPENEPGPDPEPQQTDPPKAISAPPKPKPTQVKNEAPLTPIPTTAKNTEPPKPTRPGYGPEVWSFTANEMGRQLKERREYLGVPREVLGEKANSIGLDSPGAIKPDQFMSLMDWMQSNFGDAMANTHPQSPEQKTEPQAPEFDESVPNSEPQDIVVGADEKAPEPQDMVSEPATDSAEGELNWLLNSITDDYTWEQTLELASQMGFRSRGNLETEVLKMNADEWEKLDGTPATAARRLIRFKIHERDSQR